MFRDKQGRQALAATQLLLHSLPQAAPTAAPPVCFNSLLQPSRRLLPPGPSIPHLLPIPSSRPFSAQAAVAVQAMPDIVIQEPEGWEDDPLSPQEIVDQLDRFIVGQKDAKRAVAVALRNRWRRHKVAQPLRDDIMPKNILMIGPTGVGKTEIARRLAKLADAPFVKVEATKFTEVGFHGRDVDQIIRDLMDNAIVLMKSKLKRQYEKGIKQATEDRIIELMCGEYSEDSVRTEFRDLYRQGRIEQNLITLDVPVGNGRVQMDGNYGPQYPQMQQEMVIRVERAASSRMPKTEKKQMKISEARTIIEDMETEKIVTQDLIHKEALKAVEQDGIVFIDEIDKIVTDKFQRAGADASSEGVQRDLLPIIEGSCINTKYGNVNTDYILFVCSGAFHSCKPSDMLAELQGRLPIRVELKGLSKEDFYRILTEPESNLLRQQQALLATEGIDLSFTDDSIREISRVAEEVNQSIDNIGARRLHTIVERIVEEISFDAPALVREYRATGCGTNLELQVDRKMVLTRVGELLKKQDLSRYIL